MARNFYRMLFWICTTQLKVIQNVQLHAHACLHVQNSHFCCLKTISVFDLKLFLRKFILGSINITYTKTVILDPKTIKIVWVCRSLIGHKSKIMIWLFDAAQGCGGQHFGIISTLWVHERNYHVLIKMPNCSSFRIRFWLNINSVSLLNEKTNIKTST